MHASYYDVTPYHLLAHRSNHYFVEDGVLREGGLDFDTGITVSNGGLNAPVTDMIRYVSFLVGASPEPAAARVLRRASLEEMWVPQIPIPSAEGLQQQMGLAFFLVDRNGRRFVGHTGHQRAFASFLYVHPESQTGAIAVFNTAGRATAGRPRPDTDAVFERTRATLMDRIFPLFDQASAGPQGDRRGAPQG